ncbi:MAG: hypothetical protein VB071_15570 [Lawsonibacter sp.]|nr:hypothetical protein [Lawsonibacter sp.]
MYFLEEKVPCVVNMPYSYERRALGTLHSERWKQRYACEDKKPLQDLMKQLSGEYRIVSNAGEPEKRSLL